MLLGSHIHYVIKIMFFYDLFKTNLLHGYGCTVNVINLTEKQIIDSQKYLVIAFVTKLQFGFGTNIVGTTSGQQSNRMIRLCDVETILRETTKESSCWHDDVDYQVVHMKEVVEGVQGYPRHPR